MENETKLDLELEQTEQTQETQTTEETSEEVVTIPKKEFNSYRRKAMAYDATKGNPINKTKTEPDNDLSETVKRLELSERKRTFAAQYGLSVEETDAVFNFSGNNPTKETLENPFIKAGIESLRKQKSVESNIPMGGRSGSPMFGEKPFEQQTEAERKQAFEARMKALRG